MRLSRQQLADNEAKIRAAMASILDGDIPPGGKCDIKTLAGTAGVDRAPPSTALVPTRTCAPSSSSALSSSAMQANSLIPAMPRSPASRTRSAG